MSETAEMQEDGLRAVYSAFYALARVVAMERDLVADAGGFAVVESGGSPSDDPEYLAGLNVTRFIAAVADDDQGTAMALFRAMSEAGPDAASRFIGFLIGIVGQISRNVVERHRGEPS